MTFEEEAKLAAMPLRFKGGEYEGHELEEIFATGASWAREKLDPEFKLAADMLDIRSGG